MQDLAGPLLSALLGCCLQRTCDCWKLQFLVNIRTRASVYCWLLAEGCLQLLEVTINSWTHGPPNMAGPQSQQGERERDSSKMSTTILEHNHIHMIACTLSPLPYCTGERQATGPTHIVGKRLYKDAKSRRQGHRQPFLLTPTY